jgi:uncharacterized membrane protein YphA (DoxX/SURF4 family)
VVWPVVAAVLAAVVLVAVFVIWRKWRTFRSRFQIPDRSPGRV